MIAFATATTAAAPHTNIIAPLLAFVVVLVITLAIGARFTGRSRFVRQRLGMTDDDPATPQSGARERRRFLSKLTGRLSSRRVRESARAKALALLEPAGMPMTVERYFTIRTILIFVATPLFALLMLRSFGLSLIGVAATAMMVLVTPRLLGIYLKRLAKTRAQAMERHLPDALDLIVVCVEGGLSLQAALLQVANRFRNIAGQEFRLVLDDLNAGLPVRDAFLGLGRRSQADSVGIFCSTVIQADKVGMSIGSTMRGLAETMRTRRRQNAEERARKAPIKMMPVLVIFMLPTLFVIILTPAVLQLMQVLGRK